MKDKALKELMRECSALITEKTQEIYDLVPGTGDEDAKVMFVTTYPSAKEEMTGIYFEGNAGKNFDRFLEQTALIRDNTYITYAVKYRPYAISERSGRIINRDVTMEEVRMFSTFLMTEVETIEPKVIVALGDLAYSALMNMEQEEMPAYGAIQAQKINGGLYDVMVLPHPSERRFSKVAVTEEMKQGLTFLEEAQVLDDLYTKIEAPEVTDIADVEENVIYDRSPIPLPKRTKKTISGKHKVILIYGGTQLSNDPSYVVAERVSGVLTELNVSLQRIDLYKNNYQMDDFLDQLEEADGVIIATTVEWFGIGGLLQTFLDKAYASGQFRIFEGTYLFNIAISRNGFEREASNHILRSWEILGGIEGVNLSAAIKSSADIETNNDLLFAIDKKAEDFYRIINQQRIAFPNSVNDNKIILKVATSSPEDQGEQLVMKQVMGREKKEETIENQMSFISNYDEFIEKQQQDINDIASLFKERLATDAGTGGMKIPELFEYKYRPDRNFNNCSISWVVNDTASENFVMNFRGAALKTKKGKKNDADVIISSGIDTLNKITQGKLTIQRAFMTGEVKAKGNFTLLYKLDSLFGF